MIHMKMLRRLLYILPVIGIMIASCVDIESKDFEHIGSNRSLSLSLQPTLEKDNATSAPAYKILIRFIAVLYFH